MFPEKEGLLWSVNVSASRDSMTTPDLLFPEEQPAAHEASHVSYTGCKVKVWTFAFVWVLEVQQILKETIHYFPTAGSAAYHLQCG